MVNCKVKEHTKKPTLSSKHRSGWDYPLDIFQKHLLETDNAIDILSHQGLKDGLKVVLALELLTIPWERQDYRYVKCQNKNMLEGPMGT